MKFLFLSGGGTKFIGHVATTEVLIKEKKYKPDIIVGVSAGGIASVPIAMGLWDEIRNIGLNLCIDDFYDKTPVKENGDLKIGRTALAIINGRNYIGLQNITKLVKRVITEEVFEKYKEGDYAECFSMAVSLKDGEKHFRNIKELSYEEYLISMEETSAIPIMTKAINGEFVDGGMFDHNPAFTFLEKYKDKYEIEEVYSVYTRPKIEKLEEKKWDKSIITTFGRILEAFMMETSKNDEFGSKYFCLYNNIKLTQLFMPRIMKGFYDVDKDRLSELYCRVIEETRKALNI